MSDPTGGVGFPALVAGAVAGLLTWVASRRTEKKVIETPEPIRDIPIPATPTEQQVFIGQLMTRLERVEAKAEAQDLVIEQMRKDQDYEHEKEQNFGAALGRWLSRIYAAWGSGNAMPMPMGDDLHTLQNVIPRG